ncbi:MAG: Fis family transcriptional regulator [Candidatus Acidiferrales bacterium]
MKLVHLVQKNGLDRAGRFGASEEAIERGNEIMSRKKNPHVGSRLDDFLKAEGVYEELQTEAIKEVVAWQLGEVMKERGVSKAGMAKLLHTSRTQVNRLLDPRSDITISSLQRAAELVGRQVKLELV